MGDNLRLTRFYLALLLIFTVGRWGLSFGGADYEATHQVFSLVILTNISTAYYGYIVRSFAGGGIKRALAIGALLGIISQVVIFASTAISYMGGMETFWNYPRALNATEPVAFGDAMVGRTITLVANTVTNVITAALGYGIASLTGPRVEQ